MGYNGWSNYETWDVALWINNGSDTHEERCRLARRARHQYALAEDLRAWVLAMMPDLGASMFTDLLWAAIGKVNWDELASHWYTEAHEDEEDDNEP